MRRALYSPIPREVINDDAELTFDIVRRGMRILYETRAISTEYASIDIVDDYFVKVRMVAGGYQTIVRHLREIMRPSLFSFMFISHKVLRWLAPVFLVTILVSNLFMLDMAFYFAAFLLQMVFYGLAASGWFFRKWPEVPPVIYIPFYFAFMNMAALHGLLRFLGARQQAAWRKAKR